MHMKKVGRLKAALLAAASALLLGGTAQAQDIMSMVAQANAQLEANGKNYRLELAEYVTDLESETVGRELLFNNRGNKHLAFDFVPGDPRRIAAGWGGPGTNITFAVDNVNLTADLGGTSELDEIRAAMATWENVQCSTIPLTDRGNTGVDVGAVQQILGFGGTGGIAADVQHAGFLPPGFFLLLGSSNILGVTFTFIWVDGLGNPTDIDNNGTFDAAFREIYYNDGFTWEIDPNDQPGDGRFDLQTVALHEAGHGLSQGHFGAAFTTGNGKLHVAPLAVMNAGYIFGQQQLAGSDNGGHCSNWAQWPTN
jgi:hypothetical protein